MSTFCRRAAPVRTLVDAQLQRVVAGDTLICNPDDTVWFRAEHSLVGSLGPGRHVLAGGAVPGFLRDHVGARPLHLYFVASQPVRFRRSLVAFASERALHVVVELPFTVDVDLEITSFDRLFLVAAGMLDVNQLDFVVDNETGLVAKKAIEDAAWGLTAEELRSLGHSERMARVRETLIQWWDRYALRPTRLEVQVGVAGTLARTGEDPGAEQPAEIAFGKRAVLVEADGSRRAGVIADIEGQRVKMNWDDGGTSWVGAARLRKPVAAPSPSRPAQAPPSGRRVHALCADGVWRPGTALAQHAGWWDVQLGHGLRVWLAPACLRFSS